MSMPGYTPHGGRPPQESPAQPGVAQCQGTLTGGPAYPGMQQVPPQLAVPHQGATPYQGSAPHYGGAPTQASTKKIPTAFFLGIATWVAIFLIIGVSMVMAWSMADRNASEQAWIAVIPMFGFLVVVPPLALFGLIVGVAANKRLMTRKQLIMNRIGIVSSVAPFVAFFLFYAGVMIMGMVVRGH